MKLTFEVTIDAPRRDIEQALHLKGASESDIKNLLKPDSTLEIGDLYDSFVYQLESEVTSVESDQGVIETS